MVPVGIEFMGVISQQNERHHNFVTALRRFLHKPGMSKFWCDAVTFSVTALFSNKYVKYTLILEMEKI